MLEAILPYCPAIILAELAILMLLLFRRQRRSSLLRMIFALFGFFSALMFLMVAIVQPTHGTPAFTNGAEISFPIAVLILGVIIFRLALKERDFDAGAQRRKRPLILDMIGCGIVGAVVLVLSAVAILFMTGLIR